MGLNEARLLASIVASTDDAVVAKDLDGRILSWNPAAERLFGYTAEEIVGRSIRTLLPDTRADDFFSILDRIRRGERIAHYETVRKRKDGSLVEVSLTVSPIYDEGGIIGASKIARDLTSLREMQREKERTRELFLATLGHELRNPLNTIVVTLAHFQKRIPEPFRAATNRMMSSATRMTRMIDQLLNFTLARLGEGIPLMAQPSDLREICMTAIEELQVQYPNRIRLTSRGEFIGLWDADRIAEVIHNLLENGLNHGKPGGLVEVELTREDGTARIEVRNQGPVIPDAARAEIFEPFKRLSDRQAERKRGLGLGLFIAREIVLSHGGTIEVMSENRGTTFTVKLPIRPKPD